MRIANVKAEDMDALFAIEQKAHMIPWSRKILESNQGKHFTNLKLEFSDRIVGFALCSQVLDEATLLNLAVTPEFQGKGGGKALLNALVNELKQKNVATIWLEVRQSNHIAQHLYRQFGFDEVDVRKNYYPTTTGEREDALIMALYIN